LIRTEKVAYALRGVFRKLRYTDSDKIDLDAVYAKIKDLVPSGEWRNELTNALNMVTERVENKYKGKMAILNGLKSKLGKEEEDRKKVLGAVGKVVQDIRDEEDKKKVLGAVGKVVEDVRNHGEKKGFKEKAEEVRLLLDAWKRLKHKEGANKAEGVVE